VLADLAALLARRGVAWYVFGAQAVVVWGRPRLTADVDVTVRLAGDDVGDFVEGMAGAGFRLRVADAAEFVRRTRVLPFAHAGTAIPLDVVIAGPGLEEVFLERARKVDLEGIVIPVISPEDLIITKVLAGRPKDVDDIGSVLRAQAERLDVAWIREALGTLEVALDQSDLLPLFESELSRLQP
jgi:Nucleotidyltransferase of unknown function (DUF6036)